jgi:hypothetical protein
MRNDRKETNVWVIPKIHRNVKMAATRAAKRVGMPRSEWISKVILEAESQYVPIRLERKKVPWWKAMFKR